jgi:serine/threonine protein kinase
MTLCPNEIPLMTQAGCPEVRHLQAILDAGSVEDEPEELLRHLETCADCQQTLEALVADAAQWAEAALGVGLVAQEEPVLRCLVEQLKEDELLAEDEDLSFLRPADKPGLLGVLGPYEVQEEIGRGAMGVVLKALDPALNRVVALKVLSPRLATSATARRRFVREGRAAAAVCHEYIVTVHTVNDRDGLPYLVMQYVAGESLQARLDRTGPLEVEDIMQIALQTASGLAAAHAQGLIHRDIKPANLLLEEGLARVKITDFGLARMVDDVSLTQNGVVAGTPEYMSPEQARGEPLDHRADLFSLGSVLYAMCTGVPPFHASSTVAVLRQVSDQVPPPIRELNPEVPAWLEALVVRLMAKTPADRFQSATEVVKLLEAHLAHLGQPATLAATVLPPTESNHGETPSSASWNSLVWRSLHRLWMPVLVLVVVLLGALGMAIRLGVLGGGSPPNMQAQESNPVKPRRARAAFDFRTGIENYPALSLQGPNVDTLAKTDSQGLRVTIPGGQQDTRPVFVELNHRLRGDFDIAVGYELLAVGAPAPQYGAGVALHVQFDSPSALVARLGRNRKPTGERHGAHKIIGGPDGQRQYLNNMDVPATGTKGKLRLVRNGSNVEYLVAAEGQNYKTLQVVEFGTADVQKVQLDCFTMYTPISLDVRLTELVIEADQFPDGMPSAPVPTLTVESPPKSNSSLLAVELLGALLAIIMLVGLGAWLYVRSNGRKEQQAPAEAVAQPISFACLACGKNLKAKAELVGKKVKCTQCGQPALVVETKAGQADDLSR